MINGMTTSITTSRDTKIGALMDAPLNSRMLFIRRFTIAYPPCFETVRKRRYSRFRNMRSRKP